MKKKIQEQDLFIQKLKEIDQKKMKILDELKAQQENLEKQGNEMKSELTMQRVELKENHMV